MTSELIDYPSAAKVLDCVDNLRNTDVTQPLISEIVTSICALTNYCNTKYLKEFPLNVVCKQSITLPTEIKSWYIHDLNRTNIPEFISSTFEELKRDPYRIDTGNRCIDALCIFVDYINAVILSRTEHYLELELQEKKLDGIEQSSNSEETSIHLVNGEVYG